MRSALLIALAATGLLTGCWDRVEVSELGVVIAAAIDKAEAGGIELTVALSVPARISPPGVLGGGPQTQPPATTLAAQGRTVAECVARLQDALPRRLYWAHIDAIVFGEEIAREGIGPLLDFFQRIREPRLRVSLLTVSGRAADALAVLLPFDELPGAGLADLLEQGTTIPSSLREFSILQARAGVHPMTPHIAVERGGAVEPGRLGVPAEDLGTERAPHDPHHPAVHGAAVYRGHQLAGVLDEEQVLGAVWLLNARRHAAITVPIGRGGDYVSFRVLRFQSQLRPEFSEEAAGMRIRTTALVELIDNQAGIDVTDPRVWSLMERETAAVIAGEIRLALSALQGELRTDAVGFGDAVRRAEPKRWEKLQGEWDAIFPRVQPALEVEVSLRRTGLVTYPLGLGTPRLSYDELRLRLDEERDW